MDRQKRFIVQPKVQLFILLTLRRPAKQAQVALALVGGAVLD